MRNWKELGEVPDSDDESLDSSESQHEVQHEQFAHNEDIDVQHKTDLQANHAAFEPTATDVRDVPSPKLREQEIVSKDSGGKKTVSIDPDISQPNVNDIWDIPASPKEALEQTILPKLHRRTPPHIDYDGPPFSPLSPPLDNNTRVDEIDELGILPPVLPTPAVGVGPTRQNGIPPIAKPLVAFEEDEISTPYVTITAPLPGRLVPSQGPANHAPPSAVPSSSHADVSAVAPPARSAGRVQLGADFSGAPVRGRRSLRPRKPIQQHPYLLESVQYAHVMKSHGVKPIRVIVPEASDITRTLGEDSQDPEFEDTSQEQTDDRRVDVTDESQPILFDDMDDDQDVLSPSPPRTSPPKNMLLTSSQRSEDDRTDNTSVLEDDFPSIEDLIRRPPKSKPRTLKRQLSSKLLPRNKRVNTLPGSSAGLSSPSVSHDHDVWMLPPSSPAMGAITAPSQDLGNPPRSSLARHSGTTASLAVTRKNGSSNTHPEPAVDITNPNGDDDSSGSETASTASSSKSGSEVIRRNGKRIRGVLPASWLRLDQQKSAQAKRKKRRTPQPSPEPGPPRRGVAIPRAASPKLVSSALPPFFSDDSDDNEPTTVRTTLAGGRITEPDEPPLVIWSDREDTGSVVEEDLIDRMFVGRKRSRPSLEASSTTKKRKTTDQNNPFQGQTGLKRHQPRITEVLERSSSKTTTVGKTAPGASRSRKHKLSHPKQPVRRAVTPPLLSVLDVVDSKAPPFLKIAARTAKRRHDLGKSSPSHKHINLGTRKDNVDALSVLRDWKSGRIRSKTSKPRSKKTPAREPLHILSVNHSTSPTVSRETKRAQPSESGDPSGEGHQKPRSSYTKSASAARAQSWTARPAQLETEEEDLADRVGFLARKRALDAVFRKTRRDLSTPSLRLEEQWDSIRLANQDVEQPSAHRADNDPDPQTTLRKRNAKSRFRKRVLPKPVDLEAAHYVYANDPLPPEDIHVEETEERQPQDKLNGLGPYGTKYTYHFEVFPLDRGVYFHSSTLVGSGWINKVIDPSFPERTRQNRTRSFFSMDGKNLRWGPWDDSASSELGILMDWTAEQLLSQQAAGGEAVNTKPRDAAVFLLSYIVNSISFADEESEKSFVSRSIDVVDGFLSRINEARGSTSAHAKHTREIVEVLTYLTLVVQAVRQIAGSTPTLRFQADTLLTKTAKSCITSLFATGLEDLRTLYGDLQRLSARERGIRSDCIAANSWVVLMRILENARIPRASFWDVTQTVMMGSNGITGSDVRVFESLWRDMFTLLPLSEVDDFGVVKSGMRHTTPVEGWSLPQQILKRVFGLYVDNPRQPPSFNEYCRALAARCHYLVQDWGWRKCAGIIGTWFDFFGSQNLSHLRNEEVYKSPRFLEDLGGSPSLAIDPEDRCFHIFLKVLALVIRRLRKLGLTNDVKNLVTRTLPNHNRQYLKEDTVHQRDLAALRNHHDLICTLFWAAPPDLRPAIRLMERLVTPGSSHKEACLINIRAWGQLARFIVSSGEGSVAFRPFSSWQNNIFQQILDQYLSAASDIQQQVLALPKEGPRVAENIVDSVVKQNRAVAMDMLFVSVKASFDVLKLAGSLSVATYALNIYQLQQVFTRFDFAARDFDWTIVNLALDMLDHYVSMVEKAAEVQYSSDMTDMTDSQDLEEATLLLDHKIAERLFSLGRTMLELPAATLGYSSDIVRCIEKTIKLSARVACRFIHSGFTRTANYFTSGKYGVFRELPLKLGSPQRKFLLLFIATLIKNHVYDFKDVGATLFQLWMVSIVKPYQMLAYENYLAEILRQRNLPYLERATVLPGVAPNYRSNFDLFACGISHMRKALREADSTHGRQLRDEYAKTLQSAMQKMRDDLVMLRPDPVEHREFMDFVRRVIGLIKSHGVGICVVHPFFTQPSADYAPPMEDPQLHTAGIIAYGVRLGEGDTMAVSQLFYYLYNNFKIALANGKLDEEVGILENAMGNPHIFSFVLSRALPAIIWATSKIYDAWPLFDVYLAALRNLLTRSILSKEISEDNLVHVSTLLFNILTWFRTLRCINENGLTKIQLHIITQLMELAAIFQPSLIAHLYSQAEADSAELHQAYTFMARFAEEASEYLDEVLQDRDLQGRRAVPVGNDTGGEIGTARAQSVLSNIRVASMCRGILDFDSGPVFQSGRELDPQVDLFANEIVKDVRKSWVVTSHSVSLNIPGRAPSASSTQTGPGTRYELLDVDVLFSKLRDRLRSWRHGGSDASPGNRMRRKRRMTVEDELLF